MNEVYIWGAGHFGALAALDMEQKGRAIAGFIDSDKKLHRKRRLGYEVFAPAQIIKTSGARHKIVIAAWFTVNEMADELKNNGYVYGKDFEIYKDVMANYNKQTCKKPCEHTCTLDINRITDRDGKPAINDLEIFINKNILFDNEIILFGHIMGPTQILLCDRLKAIGAHVSYFCENGNNSYNKQVSDIEIISPGKLKELDKQKNIVVIIASSNAVVIDKLFNKITNLNLKTCKIYTEIAAIVFGNMYYFESELKAPNWLLVYQMGKVGSKTLCKSIEEVGIKCIHVHQFKPLKSCIPNANQIKIITLVREPVSRNLSEIFQNLISLRGINFENIISSRLIEGRQFFDWFDHELKEYFGIDIYAYPFDKEKGYSIIKEGCVEVLVLKLEKVNFLEQVIGEFIGAPQFKLINDNEGDKKDYKYLYKNIKDTITIPREIFDIVYNNNPKFNHFYSEVEKAEFLKKWEKNIAY